MIKYLCPSLHNRLFCCMFYSTAKPGRVCRETNGLEENRSSGHRCPEHSGERTWSRVGGSAGCLERRLRGAEHRPCFAAPACQLSAGFLPGRLRVGFSRVWCCVKCRTCCHGGTPKPVLGRQQVLKLTLFWLEKRSQ